MIPQARGQTIVNSGTGQIRGTWQFDFEAGLEGIGGGADVWWEQQTSIIRNITPLGSAKVFNLGVVDFASVSYSTLTGASYSTTPIVGNDDGTNQLVTNDVFAVMTGDGNYSKVLVTAYGYNMQIQWVTYSATAIPEPSSVALLLGSLTLAVAGWRLRFIRRQS